MTTLNFECKGLGPAELRKRCADDPSVQLVDVREFPEFATGHISGTRLLPLGQLRARCGELDRQRPVVVICRSGKRSDLAARLLSEQGFVEVSRLSGGLLAWESAGLPLESEAGAPWTLERQVRLTAGLLVLLGLGLSLIWPWAIMLAWIVAAGLVFAALTDTCAMGLLLARMPWNRKRSLSCKS